MKIFTKNQIESVIEIPSMIAEIEKGLVLYSQNKTLSARSSFLRFITPPGDVHIKSGAVVGDEFFVIKVASGFYNNSLFNLPSNNGLMLLFSQKTGELIAILLDEGILTDLRTGLAGAIAAKHLAKSSIAKIGILGTGTQAREQLLYLQFVTSCREVLVWGRNIEKAKALIQDPRLSVFKMTAVERIEEITQACDLIVTATASTKPLLFGNHLKPGTHVTAVGTDDFGKQELDASVFDSANLIIVDSLSQCSEYGDLAYVKQIDKEKVMELGAFIESPCKRHDSWITVADLTGVAIEDLQVAKIVFSRLSGI